MLATRVIRFVLLGLFLPGFVLFGKEPTDLQLFLLIGQSNMAGRGKVEAADQVPHPRILMLDKTNAWVPPTDLVHFNREALIAFGRRYFEAYERLRKTAK